MSDLATNFQQEMERIYEEAKAFGYRPGRFLQMVRGRGGVATARRFLEQTGTSTGLATLNEHQRLDLTVEALVLKPEYASLFTKQERAIARERLAALDYTAPWDAAADNEASPRANRFVWEEGDVEITWPDGTHRDSKGANENGAAPSSEENEVSHVIENTPHDSELALDPAGVQRLMAIFHRRFPSSFTDQNYIDAERAYKLMAAERMRELIGKEILGGYIERGEYEQAKAAIIKSCGGSFRVSPTTRQSNNLLNQWDMRLLLNAPAQLMTGRLYDLLYGEGPFAQRFDAWVDVLATEKKPGVWPGATYFLMLHDPDAYIFIKPAQFGFFLKHTGLDQAWPVRPDAATYMRFLAAARQLLSSLASLGARDMIDTQSFIWTVHYYAERLAWIFQSNPDYYNLPGALNELDEIDWVVRQNAGDIHIGDIVYLWEAGANAGIVAVAHALTEVANLPPNEREQPFYRDATRFSGTEPRVMLRIDQVLSERLFRSDIANDSKLAAMAILKNAQGTNFRLTAEENTRLASLISDHQADDDVPGHIEIEADSLANWQASIQTSHPLVRRLAIDYPKWLEQTFGKHILFHGLENQRFSVFAYNQRIQRGRFNQVEGLYVWLPRLEQELLNLLQNGLSSQHSLSKRLRQGVPGYRFVVNTDTDYELLQEVTKRFVGQMVQANSERQDNIAPAFSIRGIDKPTRVIDEGKDQFVPKMHASDDTAFWRIHFPRELWEEARRIGVVGIDWPMDSNNQSVQRFKRIKIGDRVIVYLRGAFIASAGVVTRPYYDIRVGSENGATIFGGQ